MRGIPGGAKCIGRGFFAGSVDFGVQGFEQGAGEKRAQGDFQAIAELFDDADGQLLSAGIQHAVHRGGGDPRMVGQFVGAHAALVHEFLKSRDYGFLNGHFSFTSRERIENFPQTRIRTCVILGNVLEF